MHANVVARRIEGFSHEVDLGDGFEMVVDEPAGDGGDGTGPRPTQLLATSLAGCTAITIELYAERKGWDLPGLEVAVEMSSAGEEVPIHAVPTHFAVEVALPEGLDDERRRKLMVIAEKCPVHRLLEHGAEITVAERPLRLMDLGIAGRVCIVTGGSRGIGLETARMLRDEDAKVLLVARDAGRLDAAAEGLDGGDEEIVTLPLDITEPDAGEQMLDAALEAFGGVDVLVNNAGAARYRDIFEVPDKDWRGQYELNVMAPLRAMKEIAPVLAERGWGRIVNVCSTAAKRPSQTMPEYSVAKAAELSLSRLFADRFVKDGVLVNAIAPAAVEAEMWLEPGGLLDQHVEKTGAADRDAALAELGAARPNGRFATPAEIAAAIVFLCSERASYVAGAAWSVDAGTVQVII